MVLLPARFYIFDFIVSASGRNGDVNQLTGAYEGKISSCVLQLGESPVLSINKVDLIVTLVSPCMYILVIGKVVLGIGNLIA